MTLRVELLIDDGTESEVVNTISSLMIEHGQVPRVGDTIAQWAVVGVEWTTEGFDPARPMLVARVKLAVA